MARSLRGPIKRPCPACGAIHWYLPSNCKRCGEPMPPCTFNAHPNDPAEACRTCPLRLPPSASVGCPCRNERNQCTFPETHQRRRIDDPEVFRAAYLEDLKKPLDQQRYRKMTTTATTPTETNEAAEAATEVVEPEATEPTEATETAKSNGSSNGNGKTGGKSKSQAKASVTTNTLALYNRMPDPERAINGMGNFIAQSGMFGFGNNAVGVAQGKVVALTCLSEGITPMEFIRTYDLISGKPTMKASAMLAEFRKRGGDHEIVERSPKRAAVTLKIGKGRGQKSETFSLTWEEAQQEKWPYAKDKKTLKDNWGTPRGRANMMWSRVISEGVRAMMPEINHGTYTPEEVVDFAEVDQQQGQQGQQSRPAPAAEQPAPADGDVVDAEFTVSSEAEGPAAESAMETVPAGATSTTTPEGIRQHDPDVVESPASTVPAPITADQIGALQDCKRTLNLSGDQWKACVAEFGVASAKDLTSDQAAELLRRLWKAVEQEAISQTETAEKEAEAATEEPPFDADSATPAKPAEPITEEQIGRLQKLKAEIKPSTKVWKNTLSEHYGAASAKELTSDQAEDMIAKLTTVLNRKNNRSELDEWAENATVKK